MTYPIIVERWKDVKHGREQAAERQDELDRALACNLQNDLIDTVLLLCQPGAEWPNHPKIVPVMLSERLTFNETLACINEHLPNRVVILANADIVYDHTLSVLDGYDWDKHVACLTRWFQHDGRWWPFYVRGSYDSWIFKTPVPVEGKGGFTMGLSGCDARASFELRSRTGRKLVNPAWSVITRHYHWSNLRNYLPEHMPGNYTIIFPHKAGTEPVSHDFQYMGDGVYPEFVYGSCAPDHGVNPTFVESVL